MNWIQILQLALAGLNSLVPIIERGIAGPANSPQAGVVSALAQAHVAAAQVAAAQITVATPSTAQDP